MKTLFLIFSIFILGISACIDKSDKAKVIELTITEHPETREFINFWKEFSIRFNSLDTAAVRKISLDTIWLWGDRVSSFDFIKRYSKGYSSSGFSKIILDTNKTNYSSIGCHPNPPVAEANKQKYGEAFNCQTATINDTLGATVNALQFTFLKTTKRYMLFGIKNYSYSWSRIDSMVDTTKPEL